ncbi:PPE family protein [Mycobacterium paragordonae]|uniref:PPE family protein n=1 Tax=Mycobacterium paragordonae TaxID=1389713 RepID=A0A4R5W8Q7_9MYCO|nr:PPE family protein [Mycobacterium paragordonae]MDP7735431.1 PPE family protein [Mycobacterium paragordonae]TDK85287.1 PPE family protein [Mycobacterium paragordonae]TDK97861.1 PPE family protein [Mycobacterium paragordonae]
MTAPIWMAGPPEVHSASLSSGPGPGALLAAAQEWNALGIEYASAADELATILASVRASWQGPSAQEYAAAHLPYLQWLTSTATRSAVTALQHEAAAVAYTAALAAMPTLLELAANHAVHGVLVATNFFGINTIPIAVNEADYVRMWIQAAAAMTGYEAVAGAAVASVPPEQPAPQILNPAAAAADPLQQAQQIPQQIFQFALRLIGINWDPAVGTLNGIPYASYTVPGQPGYWISRLFLFAQDFQGLQDWIQLLLTNPVAALQSLGGITPAQIIVYLVAHPVLAAAIASSPLWSTLAALPAVAATASVAALAALAAIPAPAPVVAPVLAPVAAAAAAVPAGFAPALAGSVSPAVPAGAPVTTVSTVSTPPPSPPAPAGHAFLPYAIGPGPGPGVGPVHRGTGNASVRAKAPEPDSAAAAASAAARRTARKRRQQGEPQRGYADEFAYLATDSGAETGASDQGAGSFGFAGTVPQATAQPAGLITLAGDPFGGGPTLPMIPTTWDAEQPEEL